jgi:putative endonuclease
VSSSQPARKPWWRRWFGDRSERAGCAFLRRAGLRILARNVWTTHGEIDIVALEAGCLVFVEVRSTEADSPRQPAESVDRNKQERLTHAALEFLSRQRLLERPARFDVLVIAWPQGRREPLIEHHRHAFEAVGRWQMFH